MRRRAGGALGIEKELGHPFLASQGSERPFATHGKVPFSIAIPFALASISIRPAQPPPDLCKRPRNRTCVERAPVSGRDLRGDFRLVHRFVRQQGRTCDIADREDMRNVGPHLLVGRNEAALQHVDARSLHADALAVRRAADGHQHPTIHLRCRRLLAFNVTRIPSLSASTCDTRVPSRICSYRERIRRSSGRTKSGSQPA